MKDSPVPVLWTTTPSATLAFYRMLGYSVTYEQTRPYVHLALERNGCPIHFSGAPDGLPEGEYTWCLIMVDDVASIHAEFTRALRTTHGRVPTQGRPRITRFRTGGTRFSLVDPEGNCLVFIQRDEPEGLDYGGSRALSGLDRVLDNARILRDYKNDDAAASRVIEVGLRRFATSATALERGRALALLVDLAVAADETARAEELRREIAGLALTSDDRAEVEAELAEADALEEWLRPEITPPR